MYYIIISDGSSCCFWEEDWIGSGYEVEEEEEAWTRGITVLLLLASGF
jgi:hypothetical protein